MTGGRGWIALALVVFSTWNPIKILIGAMIFGGLTIIQFHMQAIGVRIPVQFFDCTTLYSYNSSTSYNFSR